MSNVRVRFAPSPTGPLHIGGVRTALYNFLLAKKLGGAFVLRIEDTDQTRFVKNAEKYILDSLDWAGMQPTESPVHGGEFGPYRQSERLHIYKQYTNTLIENGWAYKAFDTPEELDAKREEAKANGNHTWQYDNNTRKEMRNSLTLSAEEVAKLEADNVPFVVRFKVPEQETVTFTDLVRGEVTFQTDVLDDKVLFKTDGFPTYHMANVIDDYSMKISHVIRGEEWLSSTPLHVLLYKAFGWADEMPQFAHLPLILKPVGQGKLSKRDGAKLGFPVFPLNWNDGEETWAGYKETGFLPEGFVNFLAFLGWNPGTEQELFSLDELADAFSLERVSKSGARFDYDKAKWFNQQHILSKNNAELAELAKPYFAEKNIDLNDDELVQVVDLFKERIEFVKELPTVSYYLFDEVSEFDKKMIRKKWKPELTDKFSSLIEQFNTLQDWSKETIEATVKEFMQANELGFGQVLPALRLAMCGTMKGPDIFTVIALLKKQTAVSRLENGIRYFNEVKAATS